MRSNMRWELNSVLVSASSSIPFDVALLMVARMPVIPTYGCKISSTASKPDIKWTKFSGAEFLNYVIYRKKD